MAGLADISDSLHGMPYYSLLVATVVAESAFQVGNWVECLTIIFATATQIGTPHNVNAGGCGMNLPKTRLEAIPYAAQCVQCASKQEEL
jgi:hypothetical protein